MFAQDTSVELQYRLARYLKARPHQAVAKEDMAELAKAKLGVIGETVGRRLRILAAAASLSDHEIEEKAEAAEYRRAKELLEGGKITVEERGPSRHAYYTYTPPSQRLVRKVRIEGGQAIEYYETVKT